MSESSIRPAPWRPAHEGYRWEAVEQDETWVTPSRSKGRCRYMVDGSMCGAPAVASVLRGGTRQPWDYCADHLYGRWVEDSKVMGWRMVPNEQRSTLSFEDRARLRREISNHIKRGLGYQLDDAEAGGRESPSGPTARPAPVAFSDPDVQDEWDNYLRFCGDSLNATLMDWAAA